MTNTDRRAGVFEKYNDNNGEVFRNDEIAQVQLALRSELADHYESQQRNSSCAICCNVFLCVQAFSHFTFKCSKEQFVICDVQGVGHSFTDPQIHTLDGKGFGSGNMGADGIENFLHSHVCSRVCQLLGLHEGERLFSPVGINSISPIHSANRSTSPSVAPFQRLRSGSSLRSLTRRGEVRSLSASAYIPHVDISFEDTQLAAESVLGANRGGSSSPLRPGAGKDKEIFFTGGQGTARASSLGAAPSKASSLWKIGISGALSTLYSTITGGYFTLGYKARVVYCCYHSNGGCCVCRMHGSDAGHDAAV